MIALPKIAPRLALCGLAGLSLAWAGMPVIRHQIGIVATPAIALPLPAALASRQDRALDLTPVLALAPFGRALALAGADRGEMGPEAPDFSLHGIIVADPARRSVALISDGEGQALYRQGAPIAGKGRIELIAPGQVEIQIGGRMIVLHLDEDPVLADAIPTGQKQLADTPKSLLDRMRASAVVASRRPRAEPPETTEQYIDYWRHRIRKNPAAVLEAIGLKPSGDGYVIAENHDSGVRLAGLRAGDMVRSVNGQPVGDPNTDRRYFDQIAASGQARLEVLRGGDILTFSFPLR